MPSENLTKNSYVILGIDPGTKVTGYGIISCKSSKQEAVDFGCIKPPKTLQHCQKYLIIFEAIENLIEKFSPDACVVETQFVYKNIQSAMKLGMARAAVLIAAAKKRIPIFEYAPRSAKLSVAGSGSASKEAVQRMIQLLLSLPQLPHPEDAADALALAICHSHTLNLKSLS